MNEDLLSILIREGRANLLQINKNGRQIAISNFLK